MDKITFLNYLEDELSRLPKVERDKIMYEYETKFFEAHNEKELIHELGEPKVIAKKVYATSAIQDAELSPNFKNVFQAIMATLGLSFFNIFFIIIPFLIIAFILLIVVVVGALMMLGPIVSIINIFVYGFYWIDITNIIFSISFLGLGLMLLITGLKLIELCYKGILKYLKWCVKVIRRRAE
ncbi:MAG: HAAS signaling domain-containing protein [Mammaliicoccus vitulinus]